MIMIRQSEKFLERSRGLAEMRRLSEQSGHVLFIHPVQAIRRDRNENRRDIILSHFNLRVARHTISRVNSHQTTDQVTDQ